MKNFLAFLLLTGCCQLLVGAAFADDAALSAGIGNFQRHGATLATGGAVSGDAIPALNQAGFKAVLDLRLPEEGVEQERAAVTAAGMQYTNLPIGKQYPTAAEVQQFSALLANSAQPLLVHCGSGNRVGLLWALHQIEKGVAMEQAIAEGQAMGMRDDNAAAIREHTASRDSKS